MPATLPRKWMTENRTMGDPHTQGGDSEAGLLRFEDENGDCLRCGGLLVVDHAVNMTEDIKNRWLTALRCVQCGDIVDPVILKNRSGAARSRIDNLRVTEPPWFLQ